MPLSEETALFQDTSNIEPSFQKTVTWVETFLIGSKEKSNGSRHHCAQEGHCQLFGDWISKFIVAGISQICLLQFKQPRNKSSLTLRILYCWDFGNSSVMWMQQFLISPHRSRGGRCLQGRDLHQGGGWVPPNANTLLHLVSPGTGCQQHLAWVGAVSQANHFTFYRPKAMSEIPVRYRMTDYSSRLWMLFILMAMKF